MRSEPMQKSGDSSSGERMRNSARASGLHDGGIADESTSADTLSG